MDWFCVKPLCCSYDPENKIFVPIRANGHCISKVWKVFTLHPGKEIAFMREPHLCTRYGRYSESWNDGEYREALIDGKAILEIQERGPLIILALQENGYASWGKKAPQLPNQRYYLSDSKTMTEFRVDGKMVENIGRTELVTLHKDRYNIIYNRQFSVIRIKVAGIWWWYTYHDGIKLIPERDIHFSTYPGIRRDVWAWV
jgi:hypothetical protein